MSTFTPHQQGTIYSSQTAPQQHLTAEMLQAPPTKKQRSTSTPKKDKLRHHPSRDSNRSKNVGTGTEISKPSSSHEPALGTAVAHGSKLVDDAIARRRLELRRLQERVLHGGKGASVAHHMPMARTHLGAPIGGTGLGGRNSSGGTCSSLSTGSLVNSVSRSSTSVSTVTSLSKVSPRGTTLRKYPSFESYSLKENGNGTKAESNAGGVVSSSKVLRQPYQRHAEKPQPRPDPHKQQQSHRPVELTMFQTQTQMQRQIKSQPQQQVQQQKQDARRPAVYQKPLESYVGSEIDEKTQNLDPSQRGHVSPPQHQSPQRHETVKLESERRLLDQHPLNNQHLSDSLHTETETQHPEKAPVNSSHASLSIKPVQFSSDQRSSDCVSAPASANTPKEPLFKQHQAHLSTSSRQKYEMVTPARPRRLELSSMETKTFENQEQDHEMRISSNGPSVQVENHRDGHLNELDVSCIDKEDVLEPIKFPVTPFVDQKSSSWDADACDTTMGTASPDTPMTANTSRRSKATLLNLADFQNVESAVHLPSQMPIDSRSPIESQSSVPTEAPDTVGILRRADRVLMASPPRAEIEEIEPSREGEDPVKKAQGVSGLFPGSGGLGRAKIDVADIAAASARAPTSSDPEPKDTNVVRLMRELSETKRAHVETLKQLEETQKELAARDRKVTLNVASGRSLTPQTSVLSPRAAAKSGIMEEDVRRKVVVLTPGPKSHKKKGRKATPFKRGTLDIEGEDGEEGPGCEIAVGVSHGKKQQYVRAARQAVSCTFSSDVAEYRLSLWESYDIDANMNEAARMEREELLVIAFVGLMEDDESSNRGHATRERDLVEMLGVRATIHADLSTFRLPSQSGVVQHCRSPINGSEAGSPATDIQNFDLGLHGEALLGTVAYIDSYGMESEYDLARVYEEALAVRNNYVCSVLSTAWALMHFDVLPLKTDMDGSGGGALPVEKLPLQVEDDLSGSSPIGKEEKAGHTLECCQKADEMQILDQTSESAVQSYKPVMIDACVDTTDLVSDFELKTELHAQGENDSMPHAPRPKVDTGTEQFADSSDVLTSMICFIFAFAIKLFRVIFILPLKFIKISFCCAALLSISFVTWLTLVDDTALRLKSGYDSVDPFHGGFL